MSFKKTLQIDNDTLSVFHKASVTDQYGQMIYQSESGTGLLEPNWTVKKHGEVVAVIHKELGISSTWKIEGQIGPFQMRQKMLYLHRDLEVIGGKFDTGEFTGNLLDRDFELKIHGNTICKSHASLFSIHDHHSIEIFSEDEDAELMSIIGMVLVHADHYIHKK